MPRASGGQGRGGGQEGRGRVLCVSVALGWDEERASPAFPDAHVLSVSLHVWSFLCVSVWVFVVGGFFFFLIKKRRCVYFWQQQKRSADIFLPVLLNWFFSDTENNINIPVDKTL